VGAIAELTSPQKRGDLRTPMTELYALSGTPGVGKSSVARSLARIRKGGRSRAPALHIREVGELPGSAPLTGSRSPASGRTTVEVDLARASRAIRAWAEDGSKDLGLIVGHLSHLLPIPRVLLLRCAPDELSRRLRRSGVREPWLSQNVEAERVDLVLLEALRLGRTVYELDTTRHAPAEVARWVLSVLAGKVPPRQGTVDWLSSFPPSAKGAARPRPGTEGRRSGFKGGRPPGPR
jgi:adenylate kinase